MRRGDQQALDLGEGHERGVLFSIVVVSAERAEENHRSSWMGEGVSGGGGICHSLILSVNLGQSASCQRGLGLSLWVEGGHREIRIGAWSVPLAAGDDASQEQNAGNMCGLANIRSMTLGLWVPVKGNRVKIPGRLSRVKPKSVAWSK